MTTRLTEYGEVVFGDLTETGELVSGDLTESGAFVFEVAPVVITPEPPPVVGGSAVFFVPVYFPKRRRARRERVRIVLGWADLEAPPSRVAATARQIIRAAGDLHAPASSLDAVGTVNADQVRDDLEALWLLGTRPLEALLLVGLEPDDEFLCLVEVDEEIALLDLIDRWWPAQSTPRVEPAPAAGPDEQEVDPDSDDFHTLRRSLVTPGFRA